MTEGFLEKLELFKNREIKASKIFDVRPIHTKEAREIISDYHYLGDKSFMVVQAFGLFPKFSTELLGCAVFGTVGGIVALQSWFGVSNQESSDYLELTRLVMNPKLNGCNATSYLLGNSIKQIKKYMPNIRAIISLADNSKHNGAIYQACNFKYYGLTTKASDLYAEDGRLNPRGKTKDIRGVWLPRSLKHRYCYIIDSSLEVSYQEEPYPKGNDMNEAPNCCNGTNIVYDSRFNVTYTCPRCCGKLEIVNEVK